MAHTISTVFTGKASAYMPTRDEVLSLQVGDLAPNCFGKLAEVVSIHGRGDDVNGKAFVCYYTSNGPTSSISHSMKQDRIVRDLQICRFHTSHELDLLDRTVSTRIRDEVIA